MSVTILGAFIAGLFSFVSPCVLPLVPPYLCYLAGTSLDQLTAQEKSAADARRVFVTACLFVLGFTTVFVLLGASASALGQLVARHLQLLSTLAGVSIIIMGLHFLGVLKIGLLYREARFQVSGKSAGFVGAYIMGLAFAFGWTPCIGPVLAAILAVAGGQGAVSQGAILLTAYSLGIGLPFLLAACFANQFLNFMGRFKHHLGTVEKTMGGLLVVTGILFLNGYMATASFWLLETFPILASVG